MLRGMLDCESRLDAAQFFLGSARFARKPPLHSHLKLPILWRTVSEEHSSYGAHTLEILGRIIILSSVVVGHSQRKMLNALSVTG